MNLKRWVVLCVVVLLGFCSMNTKAATGDIEIQLPEGKECKISYIKVADMENGVWKLEETYEESEMDLNTLKNAGELQETAKKLLTYTDMKQIPMQEDTGEKSLLLKDMEEGVYLITSEGDGEVEMMPTLVSIPGWEGEERTYHVTVVPKFVEKQTAPKTGWDSREGIYLAALALSIGGMLFVRGMKKNI